MQVKSIKELKANRKQYIRHNGYISYIFFTFAALLSGVFLASGLLGPIIFIVIVPFSVLPLFFAAEAGTVLARGEAVITLGTFFKTIFSYFLEHFKSTFRTWRSALFSLIFYGSVLLTSIIVSLPLFSFFNYYGFADLLNTLPKVITMSESEMTAFINTYANTFNMLTITTSFPSLSAFYFAFVYLCSISSISLFYRLKFVKLPGQYITLVFSKTIEKNKNEFIKKYWSLNWPLYVLLVLSFALGSFIGTLYEYSASSMFTFGVIISLFVTFVLYGSTYLANKEVLANYLLEEFSLEEELQRNSLTNSFKDLLKMLEESKKKDSEEPN